MKAGKLNATVECNPLLGPQLAQLVRDVHAGKPVPRRVVVEEGVFTQRAGRCRTAQPQVLSERTLR